MSEFLLSKIEKKDIKPPHLHVGGSAIVLERHERYDNDPVSDAAGSLIADEAAIAFARDKKFFQAVFEQDTERDKTMVLFVASDTQYAGKGYRAMETAELAQSAAEEVLSQMGVDSGERIVNLNHQFATKKFASVERPSIRPDLRLREPQIFATPDYVNFLIKKYNESPDGYKLSTKAWAAHEMDAEKTKREELGAEGVHDILERTKVSLAIMERYARVFHANNPDAKLVIWASSHYDTISPLVKDATGIGFDRFLSVEYGGGIVIELMPGKNPTFTAQGRRIQLELGGAAAKASATRHLN